MRRVLGNPWAAAKQPGLELLHTNHSNLPAVFYKRLVPQRTVADLQKQSGGFFGWFILMESILGLPSNLEPFIMVASTGLDSLFSIVIYRLLKVVI